MKNVLSRFSFADFATYFLPGLLLEAGIVAVLRLTRFKSLIDEGVTADITTIAIGLVTAYALGVLLTGTSDKLVPPLYVMFRFSRYEDPRLSVQPPDLHDAVTASFQSLFNVKLAARWSPTHFYLVRSAVYERMAHATSESLRQNALMRLRENLLIPVIIWCVAGGLLVGLTFAGSVWSTVTVTGGTILISYVILGRTACRAVDNRRREIREICTAFVAGCALGTFPPADADTAKVGSAGEIKAGVVPPTMPIRNSPELVT
jgi:hypothetical protein